MLDLAQIRTVASDGDGQDEVPVTRNWLRQAVEEITAGREAHARLGQVFGLPQGAAL